MFQYYPPVWYAPRKQFPYFHFFFVKSIHFPFSFHFYFLFFAFILKQGEKTRFVSSFLAINEILEENTSQIWIKFFPFFLNGLRNSFRFFARSFQNTPTLFITFYNIFFKRLFVFSINNLWWKCRLRFVKKICFCLSIWGFLSGKIVIIFFFVCGKFLLRKICKIWDKKCLFQEFLIP
jgi:hypothetical protein